MNWKFVRDFMVEVLKVWLLLVVVLCAGLGLAQLVFPTPPMTGFMEYSL